MTDPTPTRPSPAKAVSRARSQARELTLKYLYGWDVGRGAEVEPFDSFVIHQEEGGAVVDFARGLVQGVIKDHEALDAAIRKFATNWTLERMAVIDRNILRLGAFELLSRPETPPSVVINEAIELGKKFSTAESHKFINGILDKIRASIPPAGVAPDRQPEE